MLVCHAQLFLFGGNVPWTASDWTGSNDSVRGGSSRSYLEICAADQSTARFHGHLDYETLGGAGFASQRTTGDARSWDLSGYDGIEIDVLNADEKTYTFTITDTVLPPDSSSGREQATVIYEYDFKVNGDTDSFGAYEAGNNNSSSSSTKIYIPWDKLKATYRGREKPDAPALDRKNVRRISLMIRSFFGKQQGDFSLSIRSIAAFAKKDCSYAKG